MRASYTLPLICFALTIIILWRGLGLHPDQLPSPLINKPTPEFVLPTLFDPKKMSTNKDFLGKVTIVNVWATWCHACATEYDMLLELAQDNQVIFYGLVYKDNPEAVKKWIAKYGNPYRMIAVDQTGDTAIDWGVYGTPETFIIDKKGVIRYKQIGPITADVWEQTLKPLIQKLWKEPT